MARYLFLLAKTKDRKFKQKTEGKTYLTLERNRPTQPSRPRGVRGSSSPSRASKLLGGMPPSELRSTRRPPGLPGPPLAFFSRLETPPFHPHPFPPPELPPPSPVFDFITNRKRRRSPSPELVANGIKESSQGVHRLRRSRLHHRVQAIEASSLEHVAIFIEPSPEPPHDSVESAAVEPPQPAPPPRLRSG